ncbi:MAG: two-component system sensor histidine kinase NtrB [Myxococcota bacterium]
MARDALDVLDALMSGVVVVDVQGRVEDLNSAACRVLETSREAANGLPVEELVTSQHAVARLTRKVLSEGMPVSEPSQSIERRNQTDTVVDVAVSPIFVEGRHVDGAVIALHDRRSTTRLERLEAEHERFMGLGRIAAGLAHEVKNPLGGIRGAGELLARRAETDKSRETAELVVRESVRIAKLVDDFMVFARGEEPQLGLVNVHRVLDAVVDLLEHDPLSEGVAFARAYDPSLPLLLLDADRIHQVVLNLARNALQSMEEAGGGTLLLTTRMTLDHRIALEPGRPLPTVGIWIEDTGCGMDEAELREAHLPFFTTRQGGTGLGLAVAEYWISRHQGSLNIESEKGIGTRVRITLPLRTDPTEKEAT